MRFEYVAVYRLVGLVRPNERLEGFTVALEAAGLRCTLTGNLDDLPLLPDQATAAGTQLLRSLVGHESEGTSEERVAREVQELRQLRAKENGNCTLLVVQGEGDVPDFPTEPQRELGEFTLALCDSPKSEIRQKYDAATKGMLAALALASTHLCGIKKVVDQVTFRMPNMRPLFCISLSGSGRAVVATSLPEDSLQALSRNARSLARHQALVDCARLLTRSLVEEADPLLSFLSAWSGLEIFVNKNFREYETRLLQRLSAGNPPAAPQRVIDRIRAVMSDKYRLSDKFSLIATELGDPELETDQCSFDSVKSTRDRLLHGEDITLTTLPTGSAQHLLRKYLRLHLDRDEA